jgi:hypothetical protein
MRFYRLFKPTLFAFCFLLGGLCLHVTACHSNDLYFLCGPDEDGCFEDDYSACACIPQDKAPDTPHCLDFDRFVCVPLQEMPGCISDHVFKNQGACLATIFQSTPIRPCKVKTQAFCIEHHIPFCDHNGEPNNCHF